MRRAQPETAIHKAVIAQLRARAWPDVLWWHTPNGGLRTRRSGALLKALGVLPGVSDILAVRKGNIYALELKASGGRLSEHQQDFQWKLSEAGGFCCTAEGIDRAIQVLESWKLLRGSQV